jgi:glyoxylase-like metal-dependent hydrolase (beta-lactamase superfamily II)
MVAVPTPSAVQVEQLTDWLYCLGTPVVQVYAIQQSTGFVLVDAGVVGHEHAYLEALAGLAGTGPEDVRVTEIFLTHGHEDHTGSAAELARITGATVRGPALDADVIEGRAVRPDLQLLAWEIPLFEKFGRVTPAPPVKLDELVEDASLLGWERAAQIVAVPGHTVGSVAVFLPEDHVLIAGDAIASMEGEPILGVFNVDPEEARASFRRLAQLDANLVCFGHGAAITVNAQSRLARVAESF